MKSTCVEKPKASPPKKVLIGGLKEYQDQYTALELQKKALEWRD